MSSLYLTDFSRRRPTLVGGDVVGQLGYGFNLGGILRAGAGILGSGARALLGLPAVPTGSTAIGPMAAAVPGVLTAPTRIPNPAGPGGILQKTFPYSPGEILKRGLGLGPTRFGSGRRRRRMNPLNLRALGRADRRLTSFARIARRYLAPSAPQRRVRASRRRKR